MHRSKTADLLLEQLVIEKQVDAVILCEFYRQRSQGTWVEDESGTAAIWLPKENDTALAERGVGECYAYIRTKGLTLMSCYLTPSDRIGDFDEKLNHIEDEARELGQHLIISGDFNARAVEWGTDTTNSRGRKVLDMAARLDMNVINTGGSGTFRRPGCKETVPDITLSSERLTRKIVQWEVLEDYTGSDHQYIFYRVETENSPARTRESTTRKWNVEKLKPEILLSKLDEMKSSIAQNTNARTQVSALMRNITRACNASMPKLRKHGARKAVYWWTEEIRQLRQTCFSCRRRYTRARRLNAATAEAEIYRTAKKELKAAIAKSKKKKWEELRQELNINPWGLGYKIALRKLGARIPPPDLASETVTNIVNTLFPSHESHREDVVLSCPEPPPLFTAEELKAAASTLKNNKAPGPDGIPSEVLKIVANQRPQVLLEIFNVCLSEGIFPEVWKKQKLVLISKRKGSPLDPSSYRPLCMLDTTGKLFEKLLKPRLTAAFNEAGGLSERQYGFRQGKSTIGAIQDVVTSFKEAQIGNNFSRKIVLLVTLDIKNAFNSLRWEDVLNALEAFNVPVYLRRIFQSYLRDRKLLYETRDGEKVKNLTAGAAQGSILGPDLWNVNYNGLLKIEMPNDAHLVGYADDIAAVIAARDTEALQRKLNQVMRRTQEWLEAHSLKLALEKTELVLLTRKHIRLEIPMLVGDISLTTKKAVRYLGVRLDSKLSFWAQIQYAAKKAGKVTGLLSKLMANIGGPTQKKRKLLMDTTNSILLYGCEIWADALKAEYRRKVLLSVQRTAALRVAHAYRTVSESAVLVISGSIPIHFLAEERKKAWDEKQVYNIATENMEMRMETLRKWQQTWDTDTTGRWTYRLIRDLSAWINRDFGEVNYYATQFLSGHGYFRKYLHRIGKVESPQCIYGDSTIDDAEHTIFNCVKWQNERNSLESLLGNVNAENIVSKMLKSEGNWNEVTKFVETILRKKKQDLDAGQ